MQNDNIEDTSPIQILQPQMDDEEPERKPRIWLWIIVGILVTIILGGIGGVLGYYSAVQMKRSQQAVAVAYNATTQFQLGLQDMTDGRLETARSRFEYVIELDPSFPGAQDKLAEVMLKIAMVKTPTPEPTATVAFTATPDMRGAEEIFNTAWSYYVNKDWEKTIETLDALRRADIKYRALDVDGMYYIALRFRGIDKILQQGSLEPGMYDLALSETFAPLDRDATNDRNWARYYVTGASFWELDWQKVLDYFGQISASLPNLRDGSGWTAMERYRIASMRYGDQLSKNGQYCDARDYYQQSLSVGVDPKLVPTATAAENKCSPPVATAAPTTEATASEATAAPTSGTTTAPTAAPTVASTAVPPTAAPTVAPTAVPPTVAPTS
jgi:tetratricopeptide (TPR) repeat protein